MTLTVTREHPEPSTANAGRRRPAALVAAATLLLAGFVASATPAFAETSGSSLAPVESAAVSDAPDYRAELEAIAGTQTPQEIDAIASSGEAVQILVDSATGEVLAALEPEQVMSPFALSPVGPGCTTTSLCMRTTSNVPYGYTGSGSLNGTWGSINKVTPGNVSGAFTWNGLRNAFAANVTANLTSPVTVTKIERS